MVQLGDWYHALRQERIVDVVHQDPRSLAVPGSLLGWPFEWARTVGIGNGQANFDEPIENLAPHDRARLYAYINQPGHVEELVLAFRALLGTSPVLEGGAVIDVGCGPFTAGLALANVVGSSQNFDYFGVDLYHSMCNLGREVAGAVHDSGALSPGTREMFLQDISMIPGGAALRGQPTLVVLSFLLASRTVDVNQITDEVIAACDRIGLGAVNLLYTNSTSEWAGRNYETFKAKLESHGFSWIAGGNERLEETRKPRLVHYALFHRPPKGRIEPGMFP